MTDNRGVKTIACDSFERWFQKQDKDRQANVIELVNKYKKGLSAGKMVRSGVRELKHRSGSRVYFGIRKGVAYLLYGGRKNSRQQDRDIEKSIGLWQEVKHGS